MDQENEKAKKLFRRKMAEEDGARIGEHLKRSILSKLKNKSITMKTVKSVGSYKAVQDPGSKNVLILEDVHGEDFEFPQLGKNEFPEKGIEILVDGEKTTGECLLPDGTLIKFEKGIVTGIVLPKEKESSSAVLAFISRPVALKSTKGDKIEVYCMGYGPYNVGNPVQINGKYRMRGVFQIGQMMVTVNDGKIKKVSPVSAPATRSLFKKK